MLGTLASLHHRRIYQVLALELVDGWSVTYNSLPKTLHGHSLAQCGMLELAGDCREWTAGSGLRNLSHAMESQTPDAEMNEVCSGPLEAAAGESTEHDGCRTAKGISKALVFMVLMSR